MSPLLTALAAAAAATTLRAAPVGKWFALRIKLSGFGKAGGDLSGLSSSATLTGELTLPVSSVPRDPRPGPRRLPMSGPVARSWP